MNFEVQGSLFRIQNGSKIGSESSTRKPSESLLEASWSVLGGSWSRKNKVGIALGRSGRLLVPVIAPQTPVKPEQVVGPESTVVRCCKHLLASCSMVRSLLESYCNRLDGRDGTGWDVYGEISA